MRGLKIQVIAAASQADVLAGRWDLVEDFYTIGAAKKQAKYCLTDEFMDSCEASEPLGYSQVVVNGECRYDFFRKGAL